MLSTEECKAILRDLGAKYNVSPRLIATRLLSDEDKQDMRNEELPISCLEAHIQLWIADGMPDAAHGKTKPDEFLTNTCKCGYVKPFCICPEVHLFFGKKISPETVDNLK